eukprot:jgi/Tetstr1/447295/TSEL_034732.t1
MDIRKYTSRTPELCEVFERFNLSADETETLSEMCDSVAAARRQYEIDTRAVQTTERSVVRFVETWRDIDNRLNTMMNDVMLTGMEVNQVFKTGQLDEVHAAREALRGLRSVYAENASDKLAELVKDSRGAYHRREYMRDGMGDTRRDNACPICMSKDLTTFMVPCGHVMCSFCASQVAEKCFTCRGHVVSKNKLFFS